MFGMFVALVQLPYIDWRIRQHEKTVVETNEYIDHETTIICDIEHEDPGLITSLASQDHPDDSKRSDNRFARKLHIDKRATAIAERLDCQERIRRLQNQREALSQQTHPIHS